MKRLDGYCYFVVTLKKTAGAHLGLGPKSFRGKCTFQRIDRNSIAAKAYLAGDNILDINGERISDTDTFREGINVHAYWKQTEGSRLFSARYYFQNRKTGIVAF